MSDWRRLFRRILPVRFEVNENGDTDEAVLGLSAAWSFYTEWQELYKPGEAL